MNARFAASAFASLALAISLAAFAQEPALDPAVEQFLKELGQIQRDDFPTLQDVRDRSEVVVVATKVSEKRAPEGVRPEGFDESIDEPIVTKLAVEATLGGELDAKSIEVVHVRWRRPVFNLSNRSPARFRKQIGVPDLMGLEVGGEFSYSADGGSSKIVPKYLVFLVRRSDGRFELATGKVRNGSKSVRLFDEREGP
jgi:hypothetical protein